MIEKEWCELSNFNLFFVATHFFSLHLDDLLRDLSCVDDTYQSSLQNTT